MKKGGAIKFFSVLILIGILVPYFSAFALIDDIADIGECALKNKLKEFLGAVIKVVVDAIKATIRNLICTGLSIITGGIVKCGPDPVDDQGGAINTIVAKETTQDIIARCIARQALKGMSGGILNIVRAQGRDGNVSWIKNWRNFQLDAQYRGEEVFKGMLTSTQLCSYFENELRDVFGAQQSINLAPIRTRTDDFDSFQLRTGCTLPKNFNINTYKKDFSGNGGWEAWSRLLEPQNNFYGVLFQSLDEANKQRSVEESADVNQVVANRGFLGISGEGGINSCLIRAANGKCVAYKDINTPGFILGDSAAQAAFRSELDWLVSVDEMNELLVDMFSVVIGRLKNLSKDDATSPTIELDPDVGGSYSNSAPDPVGVCLESCAATYCASFGGSGYDCTFTTGPGYSTCTNMCLGIFPPDESGGGSGSGQGNDPGAPNSVSLSDVVWADTDVSSWLETANLSASVTGGGSGMNLNYDANQWPAGFPLDPVTELNANAWIFVWRSGRWVASTWDWMRPGQTVKDTSNLYAPGNALRGGLSDFSPQSGETYGFMVSCLARNQIRNCQERSNIGMVTWP